MDMNLIKLHGLVKHWEPGMKQSTRLQRVGHDLATEQHGVIVITWNAKMDESQGGIKISGRDINKLRYADDTTFNGRK